MYLCYNTFEFYPFSYYSDTKIPEIWWIREEFVKIKHTKGKFLYIHLDTKSEIIGD